MKILAIGAHFDDIEIGCGGSLIKWKAEGHEIFIYVATKSGYKNENDEVVRTNEEAYKEGKESSDLLGANLLSGDFDTFSLSLDEILNREIIKVIRGISPDLILTHWENDSHTDHNALAKSTIHCARRVSKILMYRSNWYASADNFSPNYYVDITKQINSKINLVKIFKSEMNRVQGIWEKKVLTTASFYGIFADCDYAEGFEVVKWIE